MIENKIKILHLSYDYAAQQNSESTTAISDLIKIISEISEQKIISIKKVNKFSDEKIEKISDELIQIKKIGFPFGIFHLTHLKKVFNSILDLHKNSKINLNEIELIHAHKLTFEAIIAFWLSEIFEIPFYITLRQTDFRALKFRKDLIPLAKKILQKSEMIFYVAPFMQNKLKKIFGEEFFQNEIQNKINFLPTKLNIENRISEEFNYSKNNLITALRITKRSVKRKNIKLLLKAISKIDDIDFTLSIIGDGNYKFKIEKWILEFKIQDKVKLIGEVKNSEMYKYYKSAAAFILPSKSETFGLVYGEALLCGTPILYSQNTGFDGLFENVGEAVNSNSVESIENGIRNIILKNEFYHSEIQKLNCEGKFKIFSDEFIFDKYFSCLKKLYPFEVN